MSSIEDSKGHRSRLRQKFIKSGSEALHDYELLELLLTFSIPRQDVKPLAKALLMHFKGLPGVFDASAEELCSVPGIAENTAVLIRLMKELCCEYLKENLQGKDILSSPEAVRNFARMKMAGMKDEAFLLIYLDTKNHVIDHELAGQGTLDQAVVYPRTMIRQALARNAAGLIIVHNHPSGSCEPSPDDKHLTSTLRDALKPAHIRLLDHLVIGKNCCFSFVEEGLL